MAIAKRKMYLLNTVVSSYEIADAVQIMQEADEHVIIKCVETEQFVDILQGAYGIGVLLTKIKPWQDVVVVVQGFIKCTEQAF